MARPSRSWNSDERLERLKEGRALIKAEKASGYSLLDVGEDREILGINVSRWIVTAIAEQVGGTVELDAALDSLVGEVIGRQRGRMVSEPPRGNDLVENVVSTVKRYKTAHQDGPETLLASLNNDLAESGLVAEKLTVGSIHRSTPRRGDSAPEGPSYDDEDVAQLLQDVKLLFRAEHVITLLDALRPWESFLGILGESYEIAYSNFNSAVEDVQKGADKHKALIFNTINGVIVSGLSALAMTGVGAIPALVAASAASSLFKKALDIGVKTAADQLAGAITGRAKKVGWIERKLNVLFGRPEDGNEMDVHHFRAEMLEKIGQLRGVAFTIADVTTDRDLYMLLDYVHYQTSRGFKLGLNTHEASLGTFGSLEGARPGEQQDAMPSKELRQWMEKGNPAKDFAPPGGLAGGTALVRKARNMLEKAFEYWFNHLVKRLQFPRALVVIGADRASSLDFLALRIELDMWCAWLVSNYRGKDSPNRPEDCPAELRQHIDEVLHRAQGWLLAAPKDASTADYSKWVDEGVALPRSKSWLDKKGLEFRSARGYPASKTLLEWAPKYKSFNSLLQVPKASIDTLLGGKQP